MIRVHSLVGAVSRFSANLYAEALCQSDSRKWLVWKWLLKRLYLVGIDIRECQIFCLIFVIGKQYGFGILASGGGEGESKWTLFPIHQQPMSFPPLIAASGLTAITLCASSKSVRWEFFDFIF